MLGGEFHDERTGVAGAPCEEWGFEVFCGVLECCDEIGIGVRVPFFVVVGG